MDTYDTRKLLISNKSKKTIYSIISTNDSLNGSGNYNEYEQSERDNSNRFIFQEIKPENKLGTPDRPKSWDSYFESTTDDYLRLFIISKDSVNKYGWHQIFKKQLYEKKYQFKMEELNEKNWEVIYTGQ